MAHVCCVYVWATTSQLARQYLFRLLLARLWLLASEEKPVSIRWIWLLNIRRLPICRCPHIICIHHCLPFPVIFYPMLWMGSEATKQHTNTLSYACIFCCCLFCFSFRSADFIAVIKVIRAIGILHFIASIFGCSDRKEYYIWPHNCWYTFLDWHPLVLTDSSSQALLTLI